MSVVRHKSGSLPKRTAQREAELDALFQRPDSEIDYSDIAQLDEDFLKRAVRNPLYRPTKTATHIKLDSDVVAWFKRQGRGYQTRMNAVLRAAMLRELSDKTG